MPPRPILSVSHSHPQGIRHDLILPRDSLVQEVRETEQMLDTVLEEKQLLERRREELKTLEGKRDRCVKSRDEIVAEVTRILRELQKTGQLEVKRSMELRRVGAKVQRLRLTLEALHHKQWSGPADWPTLEADMKCVDAVETELEGELNRLEEIERAGSGPLSFAERSERRRSFLGWMSLGFRFFWPVMAIGIGAVVVILIFLGSN